MLKGTVTFNYITDTGKPFLEKYNVEAIDTSSVMYMIIGSNSYRAIEMMAGDKDEDNALFTRRVDISLSSVKVQRSVFKDSGNKIVKKCDINTDFFTSMAALIRYAKFQCRTRNAVDFTGFESASGEFQPEKGTTYNIYDADSNCIGQVVLEFGEIRGIHVKNQWFDVDLDDEDCEIPVFQPIKDSKSDGFRFDAEFLGFNPIASSTDDAYVDFDTSFSGMYRDLAEVIAAHPEKEFEWLLGKNYYIVTDEMFEDLVQRFENISDNTYLYCDTETTGLNINFKSRIGQADQCVGIILSVDDGESYYFPLQMKAVKNLCNGDHFFVMNRLKKLLESKRLVGHNIAFDWKVCYIYNINANFVEDTMAMLALTLGEDRENFKLSLKENARLLLGRDSLELSDLVRSNSWGENDIAFWDLPEELVRLYACADTDNTRGIFVYVKDNDLLRKYNAERVYRIEVTFSLAVAYQEFYGHRIDIDRLESLSADIASDMKKAMQKMVDIVGYEFNPSSSKQLTRIMYEELGIPEQRDRRTGRLTTSKEVLHYLAKITDINDKPKYPFVNYLLDYRIADAIRKIISQFDSLATPDGYIFSEVQQYGTTTGRVSIKKPNYQSYNDTVKKYVTPRPGYYMADTDYSSVEYRVTGNMSGNKMIKEGFYDPDFDYHTYQAARMYGVPYATVTPELRKTAKGFNFGIPYGMGNESLGVRIFGEASEENTRKAADLHKKYFAGGQEDVEFFFENARDKAVANGYTETYFGRRRYYFRNKFSIPAIRRQAGNAIIQGCLSGDTLIQTKQLGFVRIKDVVGYNLGVWNGYDWTAGDICYSGRKQKCVIQFSNGVSFTCSPIHKFKVLKEDGSFEFVECKDLKSGDAVRISSEYRKSNTSVVFVDAVFEAGYNAGKTTLENFADWNHEVPNELLQDTEFARGYLKAVFNADENAQESSLIFDSYSKEFSESIVNLLMFFGICATMKFDSVRNCYVTTIDSDDVDVFYDVICMNLPCKTTSFIVVDSVDITDEYIDMYDVCNTDKGYYAANGIVTHNTAADIYKIAVGRVFLRVCKEGWLGRVLFPGFIHDELLLEVHNSIDPMVFLKALREEFEVKIEGWCPLYMGFGFGMSWYQAKKTELPIQLQWELVDRYGENGYPRWDGNGHHLCEDIDDILRDFSVRHVENGLTKEDAQGNEIKPALNSALVSVVKEDITLYQIALKQVLKDNVVSIDDFDTLESSEQVQAILKEHLDDFVSELKKNYISCPVYVKGTDFISFNPYKEFDIVLKSKKDTIETQAAIDLYCALHDVDRARINVLNIDTSASVASTSNTDNNTESSAEVNITADDSDDDTIDAMDRRVDSLGLYVDTENEVVTLKLVPNQYMAFIKSKSNMDKQGYRIRFKDSDAEKLYETEAYLRSEDVAIIQQMYIMYFKALNRS